MPTINFKTKLFKLGSWTIAELPKSASAKLPSRGITMVEGTINTARFKTALEPDGKGSHWFKINKALRKAAGAEAGDTVRLALAPTKDWVEPTLPEDIASALAADARAHAVWVDITPMARWEWIRWIRATNRLVTRARRIEVARSKLTAGLRRPCCFNSNMCTEPAVSKNGVLLSPS